MTVTCRDPREPTVTVTCNKDPEPELNQGLCNGMHVRHSADVTTVTNKMRSRTGRKRGHIKEEWL